MLFSISDLKLGVDWALKLFGYVKEDKAAKHQKLISDCAQVLRNFAASHKAEHPNTLCFPKGRLIMQLGSHEQLVDEVISYMEQRHWAVKVRYPADCWDIN